MHAKVKPAPGPASKEDSLQTFRQDYRAECVGPRYNGLLHLGMSLTLGLGVIAACIYWLNAPSWLEWLTIPATFLYANFAEWAGHKYAMHRPVKGLGFVYKRHSLQHHRFFLDTHMQIDSNKDYRAVLFPVSIVAFFVVAFFVPVGLLAAWLFSPNVALLLVATGMAYYLNYELLHLSYHLKEDHWVHRIPGFTRFARLHTTHHDQRIMAHKNFNITYPIMDWIMGTWDRR
ncbi:fatty acid hydroxylase family protein [Limnobacter sp.]|uniref:fatty acid hydroxylase family protein n=1 Tax=Limnobacter sp. TaxID=2003368 RepID=UPI0035193B3A